uniref:Uncharacterized protein n=1 Tax=Anguilla anguilla TaxID=7936 RepID=A0A0E9SR77_ANGAN
MQVNQLYQFMSETFTVHRPSNVCKSPLLCYGPILS